MTEHYRRQWVKQQKPVCMVCGQPPDWRGLQTHHIERNRRRGDIPCNLLRVCGTCHEGPLAAMPHAKQLAIKQTADPDHYDLRAWLQINDPDLRAPRRVTQEEVDQALEAIECRT